MSPGFCRPALEKGWPGARITWAFSRLALKDQRPNYLELKQLVVSYHEKYGDEITFVPGGYFANMDNTREQVNRDLHGGLQMVSEMVGGGYRPQSVITMINGVKWGSRQGVGPIETLLRMGTEEGRKAMLAAIATHFDTGFELNNFAWVTSIWELCLVEGRKTYGYHGRNGMDGLVTWLSETRRRWPITHGEFGMLWREQFKNNDNLNYRFVQGGSGIGLSESEMEIRWFMNKDFRQKGVRPEDTPIPIGQLNAEEQAIIKRRYPELIQDNERK